MGVVVVLDGHPEHRRDTDQSDRKHQHGDQDLDQGEAALVFHDAACSQLAAAD